MPTQARSRRTVDALLEATAQVLAKDGWHRTSTNRVAARAGTSIGTLYEYFPSREALVTALIEQLVDRLEQRMLETLDQALANPTDNTAHVWLSAMIDLLEHEAPVVRVLTTEVPFTWQVPRMRELQRRLEALLAARTAAISRHTGKEYSPEMVFLIATFTRSAALQIATDRPPGLDRERLIDGFAIMINKHLAQ